MNITTIRVNIETKKKLEKLKLHPRESFEEVLERLVENFYDKNPLSEETIEKIERALKDIKKGRIYPTEEVRRRLGI